MKNRIKIASVISYLFASILFVVSNSVAADYKVGTSTSADTVYFRSTAKLEFIEGMTNTIDGGFKIDPAHPENGVNGVIRVDLRTLKTGIDTRDEHMRDNHLHTEDYPFAYFEIDGVNPVPELSAADSLYQAKASGKFYIHGNYRTIEAAIEIFRTSESESADVLNIRAKFSLKLDDFKIPRPKALFLKLAETIEVEAVFSGHTVAKFEPLELPDWPELE